MAEKNWAGVEATWSHVMHRYTNRLSFQGAINDFIGGNISDVNTTFLLDDFRPQRYNPIGFETFAADLDDASNVMEISYYRHTMGVVCKVSSSMNSVCQLLLFDSLEKAEEAVQEAKDRATEDGAKTPHYEVKSLVAYITAPSEWPEQDK